ncbi:unnamed protein product [Lepeophtheirus salmonis]|uniref:(salmon louse) hypothetical protein n=1 Tax=Lepeophtheirus salmonis TaxID=72036 RepID=A0A7R8CRS0_LEPSM|nr:unnamed protein product [Lepeophtheirus salmonis]CAF2907797.1 unnamed protein product [Lepeophtheirus salmonis]
MEFEEKFAPTMLLHRRTTNFFDGENAPKATQKNFFTSMESGVAPTITFIESSTRVDFVDIPSFPSLPNTPPSPSLMDEESPLIIGNPYSMNSFVIEDKQEDMQEGKQEDKPNVKDEDEGLHFKDIESEPKYARVNKNKDQNLKDIIQPLSPTKSNSGRFPSTLSSTPLEDVAETNSGESTPPSTNSSSQHNNLSIPLNYPNLAMGRFKQ